MIEKQTANPDAVLDFCIDTVIFSAFAYWDSFQGITTKRLLDSFLLGMAIALLFALFLRPFVMTPLKNMIKEKIRKRRADKNAAQN